MDEADPIVKVVADKGKELVENGAEFETEVLKTVLPEPVTDAMSDENSCRLSRRKKHHNR